MTRSLNLRALVALVATLFAVACGGSQDSAPAEVEETPMAYVMAVHAASAGEASIWVNGEEAVGGVSMGDSSDFLALPAGEHLVEVRSASGSTTIAEATVTLEPEMEYIAAAIGGGDNVSLMAAGVDRPSQPSGAGMVRFVNALENGGLTVSEGGRDLATAVAVGTASPYVQVDGGGHNLEISNNDMTGSLNMSAQEFAYTVFVYAHNGEIQTIVLTHE